VRLTHRTHRTQASIFADVAAAEHRALKIKTNLTWRKSTEDRLRYDKADWGQIKAALTLLDPDDNRPAQV